MHFVVESNSQFLQFHSRPSCFVHVIQMNDLCHPLLSQVSLVYYNDSQNGYIFCVDHSESESLPLESIKTFLGKHGVVYCMDSKRHSQLLGPMNYVDVLKLDLNSTNNNPRKDTNTIAYTLVYRKYSDYPRANSLVPISKHYEYCESIYSYFEKYTSHPYKVDKVTEAYEYVESRGLGIDYSKFITTFDPRYPSYFIKDSKVYTQYNMYNITGRPTNSFMNVNFLGIPKEGTQRECIISTNDVLVEFDFEAYHPRLLAKQVHYKFEQGSVYSQLAKKYFEIEEVSESQYKESKSITFKQLYGGVEEKYKHIPFLYSIQKLVEDLWEEYNEEGFITLPTGLILRKNDSMGKLKLFSYYVQNLETKENSEKILKLKELLKDKITRLVLITYDSFLFDLSVSDGKQLLLEIKNILEEGGTPVKYKRGFTYNFR